MSKYEITNAQYVEFLNAISDKIEVVTYNKDQHIRYKTIDYALGSIASNGANPMLIRISGIGRPEMIVYNSSTKTFSIPSAYEKFPVAFVGWFGANEYALWAGGQLPTMAQWQYACRAGSTDKYYTPQDGGTITESNIREYANCSNMSNGQVDDVNVSTVEVGSYPPNLWGLYDMYGNVSEWCLDKSAPKKNGDAIQIDPIGTTPNSASDDTRVWCGNNWWSVERLINSLMHGNRLMETSVESNPNGGAFAQISGFRIIFMP